MLTPVLDLERAPESEQRPHGFQPRAFRKQAQAFLQAIVGERLILRHLLGYPEEQEGRRVPGRGTTIELGAQEIPARLRKLRGRGRRRELRRLCATTVSVGIELERNGAPLPSASVGMLEGAGALTGSARIPAVERFPLCAESGRIQALARLIQSIELHEVGAEEVRGVDRLLVEVEAVRARALGIGIVLEARGRVEARAEIRGLALHRAGEPARVLPRRLRARAGGEQECEGRQEVDLHTS